MPSPHNGRCVHLSVCSGAPKCGHFWDCLKVVLTIKVLFFQGFQLSKVRCLGPRDGVLFIEVSLYLGESTFRVHCTDDCSLKKCYTVAFVSLMVFVLNSMLCF